MNSESVEDYVKKIEEKLASDPEFVKALDEFNEQTRKDFLDSIENLYGEPTIIDYDDIIKV